MQQKLMTTFSSLLIIKANNWLHPPSLGTKQVSKVSPGLPRKDLPQHQKAGFKLLFCYLPAVRP